MSMKQKTRQKKWPTITANAGETGLLGSESVDAFRGVFIPLLDNGNVPRHSYIGSTYPNGTVVLSVESKSDNGVDTLSAVAGGGVYGDDCLRVSSKVVHAYVDHTTSTTQLHSIGHGFTNGMTVLIGKFESGTSLPTGFGGDYIRTVANATTDTFELSGVTFSDSGNPPQQPFAVSPGNLPGFWVHNAVAAGGATGFANSGDERFAGPPSGRPYNRFEFYIKADVGFRDSISQSTNTFNYNIGTYHIDSSFTSGVEQNNYHFYLFGFRKDHAAAGGWTCCKHNEHPTSQRSYSQVTAFNPVPLITTNPGFYDSLTRLYVDDAPWGWGPDLTGEDVGILVDRMRIYYEEPPYDISISYDTLDNTVITIQRLDGTVYDYPFTITNNEPTPITGKLNVLSFWGLATTIRNSDGSAAPTEITVPASSTWSGRLRYEPYINGNAGPTGMCFTPNDQFNTTATGEASFADSNHEKRTHGSEFFPTRQSGPYDAFKIGICAHISTRDFFEFDHVNNKLLTTNCTLANSHLARIERVDVAGDVLPTEFSTSVSYRVINKDASGLQLEPKDPAGQGPISFSSNGTSASGEFMLIRAYS